MYDAAQNSSCIRTSISTSLGSLGGGGGGSHSTFFWTSTVWKLVGLGALGKYIGGGGNGESNTSAEVDGKTDIAEVLGRNDLYK